MFPVPFVARTSSPRNRILKSLPPLIPSPRSPSHDPRLASLTPLHGVHRYLRTHWAVIPQPLLHLLSRLLQTLPRIIQRTRKAQIQVRSTYLGLCRHKLRPIRLSSRSHRVILSAALAGVLRAYARRARSGRSSVQALLIEYGKKSRPLRHDLWPRMARTQACSTLTLHRFRCRVLVVPRRTRKRPHHYHHGDARR